MSNKGAGRKKKSSKPERGVKLHLKQSVPEIDIISNLKECPNCQVAISSMGDMGVKAEIVPAKISPSKKYYWQLTVGPNVVEVRRAALHRNPEYINA